MSREPWRRVLGRDGVGCFSMVRGTRTMAGKLVTDPCDYKYSTARFYKLGIKDFGFIKDLREEF